MDVRANKGIKSDMVFRELLIFIKVLTETATTANTTTQTTSTTTTTTTTTTLESGRKSSLACVQ